MDGGGLDLADLVCGGVAVDDLLHHRDFGVEVPDAGSETVLAVAEEWVEVVFLGSAPSSAAKSDSTNSAAVPSSTSRSSSARI